uniref:Uncharacterized protein n=1 Tax=Anguilla anguilla TaxID=7936 RepID=A0A0E9TAS1_ANGAN
MQIWSTCRT